VKLGIKLDNITFIPISAWENQNLMKPSKYLWWYKGPCLMDILENRPVPPVKLSLSFLPLRGPVVAVNKIGGVGTCVVSRLGTGELKRG